MSRFSQINALADFSQSFFSRLKSRPRLCENTGGNADFVGGIEIAFLRDTNTLAKFKPT
jgi:hypothetical protein